MAQDVMKYLKWGQTGIQFIPKAKKTFKIVKHLLPKRKKKKKKTKKIIWRNIFNTIKKGILIIKEYCYYIKRMFLILKER